jgi:hypothetical protein
MQRTIEIWLPWAENEIQTVAHVSADVQLFAPSCVGIVVRIMVKPDRDFWRAGAEQSVG